ncbi:MAG: ATP-binding protein [Saprospiraceae bacterium]|nr:ATP-binding protein [Saprospiraceae bacterium]
MTNNIDPKKIVITGPENSGKTILSEGLASDLNWPMVPEMARTFLRHKTNYNIKDLADLCQIQCEVETATFDIATEGVICDTNALTIYVWSWLKLGERIVCDKHTIFEPDLYVLCYPDVPFEDDRQREDINRREMLFDLYLTILLNWQLPFIVVRGERQERIDHTISVIETL